MLNEKKLVTGKIPKDVLRKLVFTHLGVSSDRVIEGPKIGEDAALIDMGDRILITKANPITGAENKIGWLAVHINANDVATKGATPLWYMSIILLPEDSPMNLLETIMREQHEACCELGVSIIGGHTEVTPGLKRPIISGFMLGEVDKKSRVMPDDAKIGDKILLTKGVGIEGTGVLAHDMRHRLKKNVSSGVLNRAEKLFRLISVVPEALEVSQMSYVRSMHTPTEGGVLNGLLELSEVSGLGFRVYESKLPIYDETREICDSLGVDPLKLLSSGSLLIIVDKTKTDEVINRLTSKGINTNIIGEIVQDRRVIVGFDNVERDVGTIEQDELFRLLENN